jgi:hypothetical protein
MLTYLEIQFKIALVFELLFLLPFLVELDLLTDSERKPILYQNHQKHFSLL